MQRYSVPNIQKVTKAEYIRRAGHVARMPAVYLAEMVFTSNLLGVRRPGAQRSRWLDQVE